MYGANRAASCRAGSALAATMPATSCSQPRTAVRTYGQERWQGPELHTQHASDQYRHVQCSHMAQNRQGSDDLRANASQSRSQLSDLDSVLHQPFVQPRAGNDAEAAAQSWPGVSCWGGCDATAGACWRNARQVGCCQDCGLQDGQHHPLCVIQGGLEHDLACNTTVVQLAEQLRQDVSVTPSTGLSAVWACASGRYAHARAAAWQ